MSKESQSFFTMANSQSFSANDYKKVAAWFLGPKAENSREFLSMLNDSVKEHIEVRQNYYEDEEPYICDDITGSDEYQAMLGQLKAKRKELSDMLKGSVPFFSQHYQGHMLWDTLMAGDLGYVTAMLYNQNNVATEASPVTSRLEYLVGKQLCTLMGFPDETSWGHITADGTIANIEAMWAARNMKALPLAIKEMLQTEYFQDKLEKLPPIVVADEESGQTESVSFTRCSGWQLLNIRPEAVFQFLEEVPKQLGISKEELNSKLKPFLLAQKGIAYYSLRYPEFSQMKIIIPCTHHYSWPKSATLLGLGQDNILPVMVDQECKMDMMQLEGSLHDCVAKKIPVLMTVAVIGSTAEGAVDNLEHILALRAAFRKMGLNFQVHCDAAWGGYLRTMILENKNEGAGKQAQLSSHAVYNLPLSEYAVKQYVAISEADTLTVDPHKAGFIPYPSGALCYRDYHLRDQIMFDASYIYSSQYNMGIYGLEGSKPGAAAAAVWLAHETVSLDQHGYGLILGECSYSSKLNYCNWLCLSGDIPVTGDPNQYRFYLETLIPLPETIPGIQEKDGAFHSHEEILQYIKENIIDKESQEIAANKKAIQVLRNVGADVLINPFVVNFTKNGVYNTDLDLINKLNERLFHEFSIAENTQDGQETHPPKLILMMNKLSSNAYGAAFKHMEQAWGMQPSGEYELNVLVNTVMQPWPNTKDSINNMKQIFCDGVAKILPALLKG